ncbi:hypothetical protein MRB53_000720 [Persea americana]|uniref:Uncharacterized protein n=1 Tax=Persea americana TaxID=3435 RepID=A0ACC2MPL9_PERAE|nr:hypothetical protein MRB53_000720 [Persea americana]
MLRLVKPLTSGADICNHFRRDCKYVVGNTVVGEEFTCTSVEFRHVLEEMVGIYGKPDASDLFPILARFDIQSLVRRMKRLVLWVHRVLDAIIV